MGIVVGAQPNLVYAASATPASTTRTYYVAADEVQWDCAPSGRDEAMGMDFDEISERRSRHPGRIALAMFTRRQSTASTPTLHSLHSRNAVLKSNILD